MVNERKDRRMEWMNDESGVRERGFPTVCMFICSSYGTSITPWNPWSRLQQSFSQNNLVHCKWRFKSFKSGSSLSSFKCNVQSVFLFSIESLNRHVRWDGVPRWGRRAFTTTWTASWLFPSSIFRWGLRWQCFRTCTELNDGRISPFTTAFVGNTRRGAIGREMTLIDGTFRRSSSLPTLTAVRIGAPAGLGGSFSLESSPFLCPPKTSLFFVVQHLSQLSVLCFDCHFFISFQSLHLLLQLLGQRLKKIWHYEPTILN